MTDFIVLVITYFSYQCNDYNRELCLPHEALAKWGTVN